MAGDVLLVMLAIALLLFSAVRPGNVTITITPSKVVQQPSPESVNISCQTNSIANEAAVCKVALYKLSPSAGVESTAGRVQSGKSAKSRQPIAEVSLDGKPKLWGSALTTSVTGNASQGELTVTLRQVKCEDGGVYICEAIYTEGPQTVNKLSPATGSCHATDKQDSVQFTSAEVNGSVNVEVPIGNITLVPSFEKNIEDSPVMTLNCSLQTTEKIVAWKWEIEEEGHGWKTVNEISHNISSNVSVATPEACSVHYSVLKRLLLPTDVHRQYRCYVTISDGSLQYFAAYYVVALAQVQGITGKLPDDPNDLLWIRRSKMENQPQNAEIGNKAMLAIALPCIVGLVVVVVGGILGYTAFSQKQKKQKKVSFSLPSVDDIDVLDGVSKRGHTRPSSADLHSHVSSSKASSLASSRASSRISSKASSEVTNPLSAINESGSSSLATSMAVWTAETKDSIYMDTDMDASSVGESASETTIASTDSRFGD